MTTIRLPYIDRFKDRHGHLRYYFRLRPGAPRTRLPGRPGSPEFMAAYRAASEGAATPKKPIAPAAGDYSLSALAGHYYRSPEFLRLKPHTQHVYRLVISRFLDGDKGQPGHGYRDARQMKREHVKKLMGDMADTPGAANNLLKKLRNLMNCAIDLDWRTDNPTAKVKLFQEGEYHTWSEAELAQFEERWPLGTPERTAFALHLYTGQRRSDVCAMTWPVDGLIAVKQVKGRKDAPQVELRIPVHPELEKALAAWPRRAGVPTVLYNGRGNPFTVAGYGNFIGDAIRAAKLPAVCSSHGLRKAAARRLAEAGCTEKQIMAITGHTTLKEVARYTRAANQVGLAKDALARQLQAGY